MFLFTIRVNFRYYQTSLKSLRVNLTSTLQFSRIMKRFISISRTLLFLASFLALSTLHAQSTTDWINGALDTNNLVFDNLRGFPSMMRLDLLEALRLSQTQPTMDALLDLVLRLKAP